MFTGAGSETDTNGRWGDYSMTTIDPADGMSFWHVNEYEADTGSFNWHTRIGKFQFPGGGTQHQHQQRPRQQRQRRRLHQGLLQHQGLARRHRRAHSTVTLFVQELATILASS